jgi:hypothetical protein
MVLLIIGGALVALLVWAGWGKRVLTRGEWRVGSGLLGISAVVGGSLVAARGGYEKGLAIMAVGGVLAAAARTRRGPRPIPKPKAPAGLSDSDARALLGVEEGASVQEVQAAHARLMKVAHPDRGGTSGLAAQLNAARDRLIRK